MSTDSGGGLLLATACAPPRKPAVRQGPRRTREGRGADLHWPVLLEKTNWLGWTFYAARDALGPALSVALERLVNCGDEALAPAVRPPPADLIARRENGGTPGTCAKVRIADRQRAPRGRAPCRAPLPEVEKPSRMPWSVSRWPAGRNRMLGVIAAIAPMVAAGDRGGDDPGFRVTSQAARQGGAPGRGIYRPCCGRRSAW